MKLNKKHIQTMKTLDQGFYQEGRAYLVFFKNHPKACKMGDNGNGTICLCTSVSGGCVEFTHAVHHFVGGVETTSVQLMIKTIEKYDIDIYLCYTDLEVLQIIDLVKKEPDKWHGKSEYDNKEDEENDHTSLGYVYNHYLIKFGHKQFPLIIDTEGNMSSNIKYAFNVEKLRELHEDGLIQLKGLSTIGLSKYIKVELDFDSISDDEHTMTLFNASNPDDKCVYTVKDIINGFKTFVLSPWNEDDEDDDDDDLIYGGEEAIDEVDEVDEVEEEVKEDE